MAKNKTGLHKKISSIFDGTPILKNNDTQEPPTTTLPESDYATAKPAVENDQETGAVEAQPAPQVEAQPAPQVEAQPAPQVEAQSAPQLEPTANTQTMTKPPPTTDSQPTVKPQQEASSEPATKLQPTVESLLEEPWHKKVESNMPTESSRQLPWKQLLEKVKILFDKDADNNAKRQTIMIILCVVFSVVLIFVFLKIFTSSPSQITKGLRNKSASTTDESATVYKSKIDWQIPKLYPTTLRDPMAFGSTSTGAVQDQAGRPIVRGIVYTQDNPSAIINGRIVSEGDKVSDATIVKINKESVDFEANGKKWTQKVQR